MSGALECWSCGKPLPADEPLPLSRRAECRRCRAELHVCRMCRFFDRTVANQCREPVAEPVLEKERANFCGYLEPRVDAHEEGDRGKEAQARTVLDALFGGADE